MPEQRTSAPASRPETREGFIAVGYVRRPRGKYGELSVEPLTEQAERFEPGATLLAAGRPYTILNSRPHRGAILLELEGINRPEQAEKLRGLLLEIPESDLVPLEEDRYYRFQLIGIEVVDGQGNALGRIEEVLETGANDVYVVRDAESELLLPAIDTVVKDVDVERGCMTVELIAGLERRPLKRQP
ncbi:MAG: ribosome maturation factor RimM [Dehalococcoidia bacterium]